MNAPLRWLATAVGLLALLVVGCPSDPTRPQGTNSKKRELKGTIEADGSSTVYLISEAMSKGFKKQHPQVSVNVGSSGTGGGFDKFSQGETDISNASRRIKPTELAACQAKGIVPLELQVGWDGLTVVVHPDNDWATKLTVEQLRKIWHPDVAAKKWSDVDPSWPNEPIKLFGAGPKSGTFDFFTEKVNGKERLSRTDYEATEDDNVTVRGVAGNKYALGYFGLAYYERNKDKLKAVAIAEKEGAPYVEPTDKTVIENTYKPLSRPLFMYVKQSSLQAEDRPEVKEFVQFVLSNPDLVRSANYIPLDRLMQDDMLDKLEKAAK
jgi:phosphate transport system substrate-binding protein